MRSPITAALLFLSLNVPARSEVVLAFADAMPMGAVYRWRAEIITNGIGFRAAVQRVKENGGSHALESLASSYLNVFTRGVHAQTAR